VDFCILDNNQKLKEGYRSWERIWLRVYITNFLL